MPDFQFSRFPPSATPVPLVSSAARTRNAAIDHLRIVLTTLVVLHHVAIAYGGSGGWYWREEPNASSLPLILFNAFNQSYFMGFFFLLAGYYTPPSVERKGPRRYILDRLLRLGVPLLVYFFLISTLTIALTHRSATFPFWSAWTTMIRQGEFEPGPLWFALALLIFAGCYLLWRQLRPARAAAAEISLPSFRTLALAAVMLGLVNFVVRLAIPVGEQVLWLQLGYFPCYIYLFAAGCAASRARLLENITFAQARPWLIVSALVALTLPAVVARSPGLGDFIGGWNLRALYYALWDPFVAWGVILGLLWAANRAWIRATPFTAALARSAFAAYIVHPPVVVSLGLLAVSWPLPPLAKAALVGALAVAGSFALGDLLRRLPGAARIL